MLRTSRGAAPPLNAAWTVTILSATADALAAKISQFLDPSLYDLDVVGVFSRSRKSFAMFFSPDLQGVDYFGNLISDRFARTRLVLCHPKQLVGQRRNVALVPQHTSFHHIDIMLFAKSSLALCYMHFRYSIQSTRRTYHSRQSAGPALWVSPMSTIYSRRFPFRVQLCSRTDKTSPS